MRARGGARLMALAAALFVPTACDRGEPGRLPVGEEAVDVQVSLPLTALATKTVPGTVRSTLEAEVATRVSGTVVRVEVDVGDRVAAGSVLARLDDADVRAQVRKAEAEAERARAYHRRIAALERDGAATAQELDDALANLEAAEAVLEASRGQLDYVRIRAPFAGVVTGRQVDPGDLAVPGMPVLTLVQPGSVEVEADVPSEMADDVSPGLRLRILTAAGRPIPATVLRISPAVDRVSRRSRVKLGLDETSAPLPAPGSFVRVEIPESGATSLWVPEDALVRRGQLTGLFLVRDEHVRLRWVRVGERQPAAGGREDGLVEILSGLGPGELVVRRPDASLADGSPLGRIERAPVAQPGT